MSKARLVITALFLEKQTPSQVAARYGVHRAWVYKLKARYEAEGDTALEPRSRRPSTHPAPSHPRRSSWSYGYARNSSKPATTPAQTPCCGT
jgi:transposase